ncbi:CLUMA_CG016270, isoform A [Clunio marinus]|uniref:CLUMA_CG016270, isoform A n=1 Tax=Clunio marinus TaxID=568069 RepID=A0A1J1IVE9_9DIPT|nr:CLUMA_CG016270, isoform A [Clunio marinus]
MCVLGIFMRKKNKKNNENREKEVISIKGRENCVRYMCQFEELEHSE